MSTHVYYIHTVAYGVWFIIRSFANHSFLGGGSGVLRALPGHSGDALEGETVSLVRTFRIETSNFSDFFCYVIAGLLGHNDAQYKQESESLECAGLVPSQPALCCHLIRY